MLEPTLKAEDLFPGASSSVPFQILVTTLDRDIVVQNKTHRMKIPAGSMLVVNLVDDNPRNHTPLRVSHPQWSEFFWIGRQKNIFKQWVLLEEQPDGKSRFKFVDPPESEDDEETAPVTPVGVPSGGEPATCAKLGGDTADFAGTADWKLEKFFETE